MSNVTIFTDQNRPKPALSLLDQALQMPTLRSSLPLLQRLRSPVFLGFFLNWWSENKKITAAIPTPVPAAPRPDPRTPKSAATWAGVTSNLASRSPGQWPPQRGFWTKISTNVHEHKNKTQWAEEKKTTNQVENTKEENNSRQNKDCF